MCTCGRVDAARDDVKQLTRPRPRTRRLRLEVVINAIALAFTCVEVLLAAAGVMRLWQARRY